MSLRQRATNLSLENHLNNHVKLKNVLHLLNFCHHIRVMISLSGLANYFYLLIFVGGILMQRLSYNLIQTTTPYVNTTHTQKQGTKMPKINNITSYNFKQTTYGH